MTALGLFAGTLTTLSFLPQVIRTLRTRHAADLSAAWLFIFGLGTVAWAVYGVLTSDLAVALANVITLALVLALIVAKFAVPRPSPVATDDAP